MSKSAVRANKIEKMKIVNNVKSIICILLHSAGVYCIIWELYRDNRIANDWKIPKRIIKQKDKLFPGSEQDVRQCVSSSHAHT